MAEFKMPRNPHPFKRGLLMTIGGGLAMLGGLWAFCKGNEICDRSIGHDEGVRDGAMAALQYSSELVEESKKEANDNKETEEESP